jgi:hypothetical protein
VDRERRFSSARPARGRLLDDKARTCEWSLSPPASTAAPAHAADLGSRLGEGRLIVSQEGMSMRRRTRRWAVFAGLTLAIGLASRGFLAGTQKPTWESPIHMDGGPGVPATLDGLWKISGLVVEGVVETERTLDDTPSAAGVRPLPRTVYGLRITTVFKSDARSPQPDDIIDIWRIGAKRDRGDHFELTQDPRFPLFRPGERYILFLSWNESVGAYFSATATADSVYRVVGKGLQSHGREELTKVMAQLNASDLAATLRAMGGIK